MNTTIVSPIAIPAPAAGAKSRWNGKWLVLALVLAVVGMAVAFRPWTGGSNGPQFTGQFFAVVPMDLEVKIAKDGELQSITYTDIKSEVEGVTQIIELVREGTTVKKGEVLIRLDSSTLVTRKENVELDLQRAESALKQAMDLKGILENTNATNLEAAQLGVRLAQLELEQYEKGTYPQQLENAKTALDMARLNLKNREEDLTQTQNLFAKGFVTAADLKKGELDVRTARNEVKKAETALNVLQNFSHDMEMARLQGAVLQVKQRLHRVERENRIYMNSRLADIAEKQGTVDLFKRQLEKITEQIVNCEIKAPEGGLVIYASSIDRNMREPIQEGTSVRPSQWLLRLPDISAMKAVLKIQEAQKPKLDDSKGQRALVRILGVPQPVGATLTKVSVLSDSSSRWWNPDLKEYPVELTLDETPPGLKPGLGCHAEIFIERHEDVVGVPLVALYAVGSDSYVFVKAANGVIPRKVVIGTSNETHIQILEGLSEGEEVLLLEPGQGRALLEKAGIKTGDPATRPARDPRRDRRPDRDETNTSEAAAQANAKESEKPAADGAATPATEVQATAQKGGEGEAKSSTDRRSRRRGGAPEAIKSASLPAE